jgi:hypothetical protein
VRRIACLMLASFLMSTPTALADADKPPVSDLFFHVWFFLLMGLPVFAAYVLLTWLARKVAGPGGRGYMHKAEAHMDLANSHIPRIEAQNEQIIQLLRSINAKLDNL